MESKKTMTKRKQIKDKHKRYPSVLEASMRYIDELLLPFLVIFSRGESHLPILSPLAFDFVQ